MGKRADLFKTGERATDLSPTLDVRAVAQAIEWALAPTLGNHD